MTFYSLTKYNDNPPLIRLLLIRDHFTEPGPVPFGTCTCSTCWDQFFSRTCRYFSGLCYSNIPRYFLHFAFKSLIQNQCMQYCYDFKQAFRIRLKYDCDKCLFFDCSCLYLVAPEGHTFFTHALNNPPYTGHMLRIEC